MAFTEKYLNYDLSSGDNDGSSEANAWQTWGDAISGASAGDRINVKRTSSRIATGEITWSVSGTATAPIHIRAYTSTIGDGGMFEQNNRFKCTGENVLIEGLDINSTTTLLLWVSGDMSCSYRCKVVSTSNTGSIAQAEDGSMINCYVAAPINTAGVVWLKRGSAIDCYFEVTGSTAASGARVLIVECDYKRNDVVNCIIKGNGDSDLIGIQYRNDHRRRGGVCINNTVEGCGIGVQMQEGSATDRLDVIVFQNNIIYNCAKAFENLQGTNTTSIGHFLNNNATGAITGTTFTNMGDMNINQITLTASPFVDTTNYELNNAAGGGALLKERGALKSHADPSIVSATSTSRTTFPDIGAVMRPVPEVAHVF